MNEKVREIIVEIIKAKLPDEVANKIPRDEISDEDISALQRFIIILGIDTLLAMLIPLILKVVGVESLTAGEGSIEDLIKKLGKKEDEERVFYDLAIR